VSSALPNDPRATHLDRLRARLAAGEPYADDLLSSIALAVTALDPTGTEDTLGQLEGNGAVHLHRSLVSWASLVPGERVLDAGCGAGAIARAAAETVGPSGTVVGVDACREAIEAAAGRTPTGLGVTYLVRRVEHLAGIPDRSFDCITMGLVLEQLPDLEAALRELWRVLRPGGRIVASVTDFDQFRPVDAAFYGAALSVVAWHARGAVAGRAVRPTIPRDRRDRTAFEHAGFAGVEERDIQLVAELTTEDEAWALFSRSMLGQVIGPLGRLDLRGVLAARVPHTLYLPMRFLRLRRPG
jgi:2-polyprenyl-3-methyl-5-hydroxy-6-metoxy-1,4-benzoquinol methylase